MKKLTKSNNKKIAGVCAGLAEYMDIDPTIMRVVFALGLFLGTFSFWVYLILALVLPNAGEA